MNQPQQLPPAEELANALLMRIQTLYGEAQKEVQLYQLKLQQMQAKVSDSPKSE